ncbi:RidA family protein [Rhodovibrionaceae bacterium A322]
MAGRIDARLKELGIEINAPVAPVANYVGYVQSGNMVFISGQISVDGDTKYTGTVGSDVSLEEAVVAAKASAKNIIAQLKAATDGDLDRVKRIVKLGGFVNSTDDFIQQPQVINGASDMMVEVFGDAGRHSRAAVSTNSLPLGVSVEIDCIAEIE